MPCDCGNCENCLEVSRLSNALEGAHALSEFAITYLQELLPILKEQRQKYIGVYGKHHPFTEKWTSQIEGAELQIKNLKSLAE